MTTEEYINWIIEGDKHHGNPFNLSFGKEAKKTIIELLDSIDVQDSDRRGCPDEYIGTSIIDLRNYLEEPKSITLSKFERLYAEIGLNMIGFNDLLSSNCWYHADPKKRINQIIEYCLWQVTNNGWGEWSGDGVGVAERFCRLISKIDGIEEAMDIISSLENPNASELLKEIEKIQQDGCT